MDRDKMRHESHGDLFAGGQRKLLFDFAQVPVLGDPVGVHVVVHLAKEEPELQLAPRPETPVSEVTTMESRSIHPRAKTARAAG